MSVFIHSYDHTSGTSSNGTWEFGQSIKGNYKVDAQSMDTQDYPWMWLGQDTMVFQIHDPMNLNATTTFPVTFDPSLGMESDINVIASTMESVIQAYIDLAAVTDPYAARTITANVSTENQTIAFIIDNDPIDVLWEGFPMGPYYSTLNNSVGKADALNELAVLDFTISTVDMVTNPRFLEVYIAESATQYINTHDTDPTLLFSTRDSEFTGQTFEIRNETTDLNIQIKKMGSDQVLPLTGQWYLVITPY